MRKFKHKFLENINSDQTIIFSNSLGTDWTSWDYQIDFFKKDYSIILYNTHAEKLDTLKDLGNDVLDLVNFYEVKNIHYCGVSLGGLIGIHLACFSSNHFKSITISNTSPKIVKSENWQARIEELKLNGFKNLAEPSPSRWFTESFIKNNPEEVVKSIKGYELILLEDYINSCSVLRDADLWNDIEKIKSKVQIISGIHDSITTLDEACRMHEKIQDSKLVKLEAFHLSQIEAREEFNKELNLFIKEY